VSVTALRTVEQELELAKRILTELEAHVTEAEATLRDRREARDRSRGEVARLATARELLTSNHDPREIVRALEHLKRNGGVL
jgi:hypothetical protein